jgi:uncharacterized protein
LFKRRDRRPILKIVLDFLWPKSGWTRAFQYVQHRLQRLPDTPVRIARGIFIGVFCTFTPFYGLHFVFAALFAKMLNANVLAALLGTFFGNPLTYLPIGVVSLRTGNLLLGRSISVNPDSRSFGGKFLDAWSDLKHNLHARFSDDATDWSNLYIFYQEFFFPYMIGGILPGLTAGLIFYYVSLPIIIAYQTRRKGALKEKLLSLKKKKPKLGKEE